MSELVAVETIIRLVKEHGSDARLGDDGMLRVYPKFGNATPVAFLVPAGGLARRVIIEIGKRCGIATHLFFIPAGVQAAPN